MFLNKPLTTLVNVPFGALQPLLVADGVQTHCFCNTVLSLGEARGKGLLSLLVDI